MLFRNGPGRGLAISQPAHAWISGQILDGWHEPLDAGVILAGAQHDLAWLDWECMPSFDARTGRPHLFRDVGASSHAPMWARGVERALQAWGARPALLISRHGGVIYRRFTDRHRIDRTDADAAANYLRDQAQKEAAWTALLGLGDEVLAHESGLIAFADTLSLVFCGELAAPLTIEAPGVGPVRVAAADAVGLTFTLSPWPFRRDVFVCQAEARALPASGRFADEGSMRAWLADDANRIGLRVTARKLD